MKRKCFFPGFACVTLCVPHSGRSVIVFSQSQPNIFRSVVFLSPLAEDNNTSLLCRSHTEFCSWTLPAFLLFSPDFVFGADLSCSTKYRVGISVGYKVVHCIAHLLWAAQPCLCACTHQEIPEPYVSNTKALLWILVLQCFILNIMCVCVCYLHKFY